MNEHLDRALEDDDQIGLTVSLFDQNSASWSLDDRTEGLETLELISAEGYERLVRWLRHHFSLGRWSATGVLLLSELGRRRGTASSSSWARDSAIRRRPAQRDSEASL